MSKRIPTTDLTPCPTKFMYKLQDFEGKIKDTPNDIAGELETNHYLAHGVYARELHIPAGCRLTGKIHRHSCINLILAGEITVQSHEGERLIKAPAIVVSPPGTKRAGFAHKDTIWVTVHHTEQIDPDLIEQEVITESFYDLENGEAPKFEPAGLNQIEEQTLQLLLAKRGRVKVLPTILGNGDDESDYET